MNLTTACESYVEHLRSARDLSPHTLRAYECDLAALQRHLGVDVPAESLERTMVTSFFDAQRESGRTAATLRRRAAALRRFCVWLRAEGIVEGDLWPAELVTSGRRRVLPRLVAAHDLGRLVAHLVAESGLDATVPAGSLERPAEATTLLSVLMMATTGARVNEVVSLNWRDVDVADRSMRILGKGRRERQVYLVDDWIAGLMTSYLLTRDVLGVSSKRLLFNRRLEPLTTASVRRRLAAASRRAGLGSQPTPHMLRHTAATQLMEADVDIRYIQRLLGHASLSTTEIYTHVADPALRRAVTRADILGPLLIGDDN